MPNSLSHAGKKGTALDYASTGYDRAAHAARRCFSMRRMISLAASGMLVPGP